MKPKKNTKDAIKILVAEDSPTQAEQLRHLLEERGYAVETARDGKEALASARLRKPTLIISDVVMPELDGYGLCKAIKSDDELKDVPVMLLTSLSDSQDVIRGLECGADNFVRKPFDGDYLLSRIEYLLMNRELRRNHRMQLALEINLGGKRHLIGAERQQILDLLISTYEQAVHVNKELRQREQELANSNAVLQGMYRIAEGLNQAVSAREVCEMALDRAMELPGVRAGWVSLLEGEAEFRTLAARNLPPALSAPEAFDGSCACRRRLLGGELDRVSNILECERLEKAKGDTQGLRYHASVPLWTGDRIWGVMNLVGPGKGTFDEEALKMLYGVGHQVAVALERAELHEHLEKLVAERTAKLAAEVEQRRRIQEEQARLIAIIEATPDLVATAGLDGRVIYCNPAGLRMLGFEPGLDRSTVRILGTHPAWAAKLIKEEAIPHAIEHGTWSGETALLGPDRREIPISQVIIAHKGSDAAVAYLSTIARDISLRKEHEAKIARLNRIYAVLSGINNLIVRVREREVLFREACRIAVELGHFRLAWIAIADRGTSRFVPAAWAGEEQGYLSLARPIAGREPGVRRGLAASAMQSRTAVVCNDIEADPAMLLYPDEAIKRGYRAVIALPLMVENESAGALILYAGEKDFFDDQELVLLTELAGDISFALDHIGKSEQLEYLAYYDEITGLANRALFRERVDQFAHAASRDAGKFAIAKFNVKRFKTINDTLGRKAGDDLLRQIAGRARSAIADSSCLACTGGDQFAAIFPDTIEAGDAARRLTALYKAIFDTPFDLAGNELRVAASAGIATFPADGADADTLMRNAESALKRAKTSGERYLFFTEKMTERVAEKLALENKLRRALEKEEFVLHYQPKVDLATRAVTGVEALIRWNDPSTGLVPPAHFIPLLEETGLILEVGSWAMIRAVLDHRHWADLGLPAPRIAVNVSPIQLQQRDFVEMVKQAVAFAALPPSIDLEITESLIMEDVQGNIAKLAAIREMGLTIFIDDFGTGYSSLGYLAKLPVQSLKIDRSFVITMLEDPDAMSLVSTIISLAHSLRLKVVAEGVEKEEQAQILRLLRCDEMQGYLFSKPVPRDEITKLLQRSA